MGVEIWNENQQTLLKCVFLLSTDEKRWEKADGTPKEHFQGLFISRKMKSVMAFEKYISH